MIEFRKKLENIMSSLHSRRFLNGLNEINPPAIRFESEMMPKLGLFPLPKTGPYYAKKYSLLR